MPVKVATAYKIAICLELLELAVVTNPRTIYVLNFLT